MEKMENQFKELVSNVLNIKKEIKHLEDKKESIADEFVKEHLKKINKDKVLMEIHNISKRIKINGNKRKLYYEISSLWKETTANMGRQKVNYVTINKKRLGNLDVGYYNKQISVSTTGIGMCGDYGRANYNLDLVQIKAVLLHSKEVRALIKESYQNTFDEIVKELTTLFEDTKVEELKKFGEYWRTDEDERFVDIKLKEPLLVLDFDKLVDGEGETVETVKAITIDEDKVSYEAESGRINNYVCKFDTIDENFLNILPIKHQVLRTLRLIEQERIAKYDKMNKIADVLRGYSAARLIANEL